MPIWIDHLVFVTLAVLFPIRAATFGYRRLKLAAPEDVPRVRRELYTQAMVVQWTLTAAVLALWMWQRRAWETLGLVPHMTRWLPWIAATYTVLAAIQWWQRSRMIKNDAALARVRTRLAHLERMMPHTVAELRAFERLSITAGICEELLYRGYLVWYLRLWLDTLPALLIAAALFGIGHSYQGWKGALGTGFLGGLFCAIYIASGSLYLPMVMHALTDLYAGHLAQPAFGRGMATGATA